MCVCVRVCVSACVRVRVRVRVRACVCVCITLTCLMYQSNALECQREFGINPVCLWIFVYH